MQNVQESGKCIAGDFSNLSLLDQRLIEQLCSIMFFLGALAVRDILAILLLLLLRSCAGNVEAHLYKLIDGAARLLAPPACASKSTISASISCVGGQREVDRNFILAS